MKTELYIPLTGDFSGGSGKGTVYSFMPRLRRAGEDGQYALNGWGFDLDLCEEYFILDYLHLRAEGPLFRVYVDRSVEPDRENGEMREMALSEIMENCDVLEFSPEGLWNVSPPGGWSMASVRFPPVQ